jgi:hypothetical protein
MFIGAAEHCEYHLQIQCHPCKSANVIIEIEKSILKFIGKHKRPEIAKSVLGEKSNADFKLYYRAIVTKMV